MVLPSRLHRHHLLVSPRSNFRGTQRKLAQLGASLHNKKKGIRRGMQEFGIGGFYVCDNLDVLWLPSALPALG